MYLNRNLISLGTLNPTGCIIKVHYDIMKIIKRSIMIIKGNKQNGLYELQGTAVSSDASISISQNPNKALM